MREREYGIIFVALSHYTVSNGRKNFEKVDVRETRTNSGTASAGINFHDSTFDLERAEPWRKIDRPHHD